MHHTLCDCDSISAFGGKETRAAIVSTACAVAARKSGRPVRVILDRDEDMLMTGGRHPFLVKYKVIINIFTTCFAHDSSLPFIPRRQLF